MFRLKANNQILKQISSKTSPNLVLFRQFSILNQVARPVTYTKFTPKFSPIVCSRFTRQTPSPRYYSPLCVDKPAKNYEFEDIQKISNEKTHAGIVLVDVREPSEYSEGHIPSAINIPYNSSPGALGLEPEDFEEAFGFPKPPVEDHLVFYCLGGVRSSAAEGIAATYGYQSRGNYLGSWQDWIEHNGEKEV